MHAASSSYVRPSAPSRGITFVGFCDVCSIVNLCCVPRVSTQPAGTFLHTRPVSTFYIGIVPAKIGTYVCGDVDNETKTTVRLNSSNINTNYREE